MPFEFTLLEAFTVCNMCYLVKQKVESIKLRAAGRPSYKARLFINLSTETLYSSLVAFLCRKQPRPIISDAEIYSNFILITSLDSTTLLSSLCVTAKTNHRYSC